MVIVGITQNVEIPCIETLTFFFLSEASNTGSAINAELKIAGA